MVPMRWAAKGWLASPAYADYWSDVYCTKLAPYFNGKVVADIGAGNGCVVEDAICKGLAPKELHLIDPDLHISAELEKYDFVRAHPCSLKGMPPMAVGTALFKQSFHLVYQDMGSALFNVLTAHDYIVLRMPLAVDWPLSGAAKTILRESSSDIWPHFQAAGKTLISMESFSYSVRLPRVEWLGMLQGRFLSCLHGIDDDAIAQEIFWAQANLPDILEFSDRLECLIFR